MDISVTGIEERLGIFLGRRKKDKVVKEIKQKITNMEGIQHKRKWFP